VPSSLICLLLRRTTALLLAVLVSSHLTAQNLEIHIINVGWGASLFVKGPNGTTILMEAGNTGKGTNRVVPYLRDSIAYPPSAGFDYTIAGHQHCDHIGGMAEVVNAGYNVRIKNYYNGSSYSTTCVTGWNAAAATTTAGAPVAMPVGAQIDLGNGAELTCIARNGSIIGGGTVSVSDENDRSIAALIQYGGFDFLWASDLGGGSETCTGRSTSQVDVETSVITAISPGGAYPMISLGGIDVLYVNHHGSESSTNKNWMNLSRPAVAVISTGDGQATTWNFPRVDVVEHVLLDGSTCVTAPPTLVLQTEEGKPTGSSTSFAGYCVGDIRITTDGVSTFTVSADGNVTEGPDERTAAGLPRTISLDNATLPIQLASFSASVVRNNDVEVSWHTVSETNNYGFEVERRRGQRSEVGGQRSEVSNQTSEWVKVGFVEGHGTTLEPQSYSYVDRAVPFGKYFYRIKQIDLDGKSETFREMEVNVGVSPDKVVLAQNYPNPFNPSTVIEFVVPKTGLASLKVYNVLGQEVRTLFEGVAEAGKIHAARFDATNLASGIYFYRLRSSEKVETKRMMVLK
jgi:beta-lactamase superfamily II metal-dependent hydrolase